MTEATGAAPAQDRYAHDGPYAWRRLALAVLLGSIGGVGLWSAGVALPAVEAEFGVDRGAASFIFTATMVGFAMGGVVMGRLADRVGIALPLAFGGAMLGLGYGLASLAESYWQFVATQAILVGALGASVSFGPLVADVSLWFRRRRGIAVAAAASGNYVAGAVWTPALEWMIAEWGWRDAHLATGLICAGLLIPLSTLMRRRPDRRDPPGGFANSGPQTPLSPRALQWVLAAAGLSCCVAMSMPQVHMVAYCIDLGYGPARGAEMISIMLGLGIVSRLASGLIADRIGGVGALLLGSSLQCVALFFYLPFDGLIPLYAIAALFGLAQGGIVPSYALIAREYFPAREAGARVSLVLMATVLGMALGGWLSGEIYDLTGSYQAAFLNGIAFNAVNMAIAFWLLTSGRRAKALRAA